METKLQKVLDKIPKVNDKPELVTLAEKIQNFKSLLKEKRQELRNASNYPPQERPRSAVRLPPVDEDAKEIIEDINRIENFKSPHREDAQRDIQRQILALERAVTVLESTLIQANLAAIREASHALPSEVKNVFRDIIDKAQALENAIRLAIETDSILQTKGLSASARPPHLQVISYWRSLVFTNGTHPSLSWFIGSQRKLWEKNEG